jgi:hypothetical protein
LEPGKAGQAAIPGIRFWVPGAAIIAAWAGQLQPGLHSNSPLVNAYVHIYILPPFLNPLWIQISVLECSQHGFQEITSMYHVDEPSISLST